MARKPQHRIESERDSVLTWSDLRRALRAIFQRIHAAGRAEGAIAA